VSCASQTWRKSTDSTKPDSPTRAKKIDPADELRAKQVAFLAAVAELGTITRAALAAGVHRSMHYDWLNDEAYTKAFADAEEMFRYSLRQPTCESLLYWVPYSTNVMKQTTGLL
jgi:hypothetical protein